MSCNRVAAITSTNRTWTFLVQEVTGISLGEAGKKEGVVPCKPCGNPSISSQLAGIGDSKHVAENPHLEASLEVPLSAQKMTLYFKRTDRNCLGQSTKTKESRSSNESRLQKRLREARRRQNHLMSRRKRGSRKLKTRRRLIARKISRMKQMMIMIICAKRRSISWLITQCL